MARVEIQGRTMTVLVDGFDQVLAMRAKIIIPITHVLGAHAHPDMTALLNMEAGTALRGALVPGRLIVGTCPLPDGEGMVFCDVHDPARAISIELRHNRFRRILVEVSDESPEAVCERIEEACTASRPSR